MFLFTTPTGPDAPRAETKAADHPLARPLKDAADATGISFDYLIKTAKRESNLNPEARAANSSATGLFQFIEQTWLGLVKRQGPQLGLTDASNAIQQDRSGRYVVPEAEARQQILALRKDPTLSARLAGVFTSENKATLRDAFGREPSGGELYIAHFMGAGGARDLISLANSDPDRAAASAFPEAAAANRPIFFDQKGRARSAREVYARLVSFHDGDAAPLPAGGTAIANAAQSAAAPEPPTRSPLAIAPARVATVTGQLRQPAPFNGFFRSGGDGQAATALRKTWIGVADARVNPNAPSFFPRDEPTKVASIDDSRLDSAALARANAALGAIDVGPPSPLAGFEATMPEAAARYEAVDAPLPPRRPATLGEAAAPLDLTQIVRPGKR